MRAPRRRADVEALLDSKFDGRYDDLPATYIWARTSGWNDAGPLRPRGDGGWKAVTTLIDKLNSVSGTRRRGQRGTAVEQIAGANGQAIGLVVDGVFRPFDFVLCTLAPPQARSLLAPSLLDQAPEDHCVTSE